MVGFISYVVATLLVHETNTLHIKTHSMLITILQQVPSILQKKRHIGMCQWPNSGFPPRLPPCRDPIGPNTGSKTGPYWPTCIA